MSEAWAVVEDSPHPVQETVERVTEALKQRQFGVLWQMDVPETLRAKGMPFATPYHFLEVCNPQAANEVLSQNLQVGYFLPCKVVVYQDGDRTKVAFARPTALIGLVGDPALDSVARRVEEVMHDAVLEATQ